jgi:hypothetical protein
MEIQFAIQSYKSDSAPISGQRVINAYAESQPKSAKAPVVVFGTPGMTEFTECGTGPIRGALEIQGTPYVVSGSELYSIASDGTSQLLAAGISGINNVSMDATDEQICIVNGTAGYVYDIAGASLSQIVDADFNAARTVTVVNSIFCFDWQGTNKFFVSDVLDAMTFDPLDFASAESSPDQVIAVRNRNGLLMVFGEHTIEPWDHTGASDFPFSKIKGGTIDRGIAAPLAIANEDASLFFLGNDVVFYRLNGLQLVRISTHALETEWQSYTVISDAFCFDYSFNGHKFIYLTFPTEQKTFGYDIATGLWHERMSWDATGLELRWRANCAVQAFNKILIGDAYSGRIGVLDPATFTEFGDPIVTTLVSPPLFMDGRMISVPSLEIDMETGVGTTTGQGSDPQIMLEYSHDGGKSYVDPQIWTTMGPKGRRETRLTWRELGSADHWTFKLVISDPVKRVVTGARIPFLYADPNQ